jgi:hypothetical protein
MDRGRQQDGLRRHLYIQVHKFRDRERKMDRPRDRARQIGKQRDRWKQKGGQRERWRRWVSREAEGHTRMSKLTDGGDMWVGQESVREASGNRGVGRETDGGDKW